jgi:hypothetical protein
MRGSPLLRVLLIVLVLLAALWPLRRLTSHRGIGPTQMQTPSPPQAQTLQTHLALTSTAVPFAFEVTHLGKVIWKGESAQGAIEKTMALNFPPEGIDLLLSVKWQGDQQSAVKLEVTPQDGEPITRTLWGTTQASDVLTFSKQ